MIVIKISEVTSCDIADYANLDNTDTDIMRDISIVIPAAKAYIKGYTGLTYEVMDTKEDLTIALMVLCNEMLENRVYTVQNDKVNVVIKSIMDLHCVNLL